MSEVEVENNNVEEEAVKDDSDFEDDKQGI